jgi:hypothetical protein
VVGLIIFRQFARNRPPVFAALAAFAAILVSGLVIGASVTGWPARIFHFTQTPPEALAKGSDIAGWASIDRDSYFIGDTIRYRARIQYRPDRVVPNLDTVMRSLPFFPFERREGHEEKRVLAGGIEEYRLDAILHGVKVEPQTTYELDPAVVFYQLKSASTGQLHSIRIPTPAIHITEYYPRDISPIPLRALKGTIHDPSRARQWLIGASGGLALALAGFLLWWFGRRRREEDLSEAERLWREFHDIDRTSMDERAYLLRCERIFSRLLQISTGTSPRALWAGDYPEDALWKETAARAHGGLRELYRRSRISHEDAERILGLLDLDGIFSATVAEDRLRREKEPSWSARLRRQPGVLAMGGICIAVAVGMFVLAARPGFWLSPDLVRYNRVMAAFSGDIPLIEDAVAMADLGSRVKDRGIKAAALYNAGTALARLRESPSAPLREKELFEALFNEKASLAAYLDTPEEVEQFLKSEKWLRRAEVNLQNAARLDMDDEDIRRNLELVIKRHRAVLGAIKALFEASRGGAARRGLKGIKLKAAQRKAMVDVLNMKWPDKFKDDKGKGKKDRGYSVLERY